MTSINQPENPAYLLLANSLERQIQSQLFHPGDRLPSVRKVASGHRFSLETVLHAFRTLEDRGLIEARPRSGYYVRQQHRLLEPSQTALKLEASPVHLTRLRHEAFILGNARGVVPLSVAVPSPDVLPTRKLGQMLSVLARKNGSEMIKYAPLAGNANLRKQLARRARDWGCFAEPDDFIITNGTAEALSLALQATCQPGSAVVVESPTYYGILELIGSLGLRVVELPAHPSEGIDLAALRTVLDSVPKIGACLFVTNHSNPLGCTLPTRRKIELAEILTGRNIPLIEDDIYGDLNQPGMERPPVVKSFDQNDLVLLCGSVSKIISPGLRVGWIHPGKFRQKVAGIKAARTLASPSITQMAVAEFLEHGAYDSHLRRIRAFFAEQIIRFSAAIADYFPPETKVSRPSGGFALWIELPPEIDTVELARRAMNQHQIAIAPGCIFSASGARFGNCFRMSCGYPWSAKIESAVGTLGKLAWELGAKA